MEIKNFKPSKGLLEAAESVFLAMAYVGTIQPIVRLYQNEILNRHKFRTAKKWRPEDFVIESFCGWYKYTIGVNCWRDIDEIEEQLTLGRIRVLIPFEN